VGRRVQSLGADPKPEELHLFIVGIPGPVMNDCSTWGFESLSSPSIKERNLMDKSNIEELFKPGTQIIYVPLHVEKILGKPNIHHPAAERGFVTSTKKKSDGGYVIFCRYWSQYNPGVLRTVANSEGTPPEMLVTMDTHPQKDVDAILKRIQAELASFGVK